MPHNALINTFPLDSATITIRLRQIYDTIPSHDCQHCHKCCGPIIWFYPEELNITCFLQQQHIQKIQWTTEEFREHENRCPYLENSSCRIYSVRPLVCRLQGLITSLPCSKVTFDKSHDAQFHQIMKTFRQLLVDTKSLYRFYSTKKIIDSEVYGLTF